MKISTFKRSNVKISTFIVIRRYLCISLLGLLDKRKSRRNLPFAFAVNLVKNREVWSSLTKTARERTRPTNTSLINCFQRLLINFEVVKMCKELLDSKPYIILDRTKVNFDRDLARAYGNVLECTTCKHASHAPRSKVSLASSQNVLFYFMKIKIETVGEQN